MKLLPLLTACAAGFLLTACVGSRTAPVAERVPVPAARGVPTTLTSAKATPQGAVILGIQ